MKRSHLYAALTLGAAFAVAVGVGSLSSSKKVAKEAEAVTRDPAPANPNHYLACFEDGEFNVDNGAAYSDYGAFEMWGTDFTSSVSLKISSAKQESNNDDSYKGYLTVGRPTETEKKATDLAIYNSNDTDFAAVYAGVSSHYSSSNFKCMTAILTNQYIDNIQDITLYASAMEGGFVAFVYQLEGTNTWHLVARDDGESGSPYYSYSVTGMKAEGSQVSGSFNYRVAFSANYKGEDPKVTAGNGTSTFNIFTNELRGRTARIGFLYACNNTTINYIRLHGLMINRSNSIKAFVNGVNGGTITSSSKNYQTLVKMMGYRLQKSHGRSLLETCNLSDYYDQFNSIYQSVTSSTILFSKPSEKTISAVNTSKLTLGFTYDRNPHTPDPYLLYFMDGTDAYYAKVSVTKYSCDSSGYEGLAAPSDPFYYAMKFSLDEPYAYNYSGTKQVVFHIDETADGSDFKTDWQAKRAAGLDGMCSMLDDEATRAELSVLIKRFDLLSSETQTSVGAEIDVAPYTYSQSIEYFRSVLDGTISTSNHSFAHINSFSILDSESTIWVVGIVLGVVSIAGLCLFVKKRRENI